MRYGPEESPDMPPGAMAQTAAPTPPQHAHQRLYEAVLRLETVNQRLEGLMQLVSDGQVQPTNTETGRDLDEPSLLRVLHDSPAFIHERIDRAIQQVRELEERLFA